VAFKVCVCFGSLRSCSAPTSARSLSTYTMWRVWNRRSCCSSTARRCANTSTHSPTCTHRAARSRTRGRSLSIERTLTRVIAHSIMFTVLCAQQCLQLLWLAATVCAACVRARTADTGGVSDCAAPDRACAAAAARASSPGRSRTRSRHAAKRVDTLLTQLAICVRVQCMSNTQHQNAHILVVSNIDVRMWWCVFSHIWCAHIDYVHTRTHSDISHAQAMSRTWHNTLAQRVVDLL
jgi:hypothetical protein